MKMEQSVPKRRHI